MSKNRTAIMFALFLMFAMAFSLVALPAANAHTPPWNVKTFAFIEVNPDPVGVGQTAYVNFWIDCVPPTAIGSWGTRWHNFKVTVTTPNGDTMDLGTFDSDATGGAWTQYVPDKVGTYTFDFSFPGQADVQEENPYPYDRSGLRGLDSINDTYLASSASTTLTVQEEQIVELYPPNPLPTQYWTRPINSMNREWYVVGGNWFGTALSGGATSAGNFNPYTTAPNTAHILWTYPQAFGGQIGGEFGSTSTSLFATGTAYEGRFGYRGNSPVVMYGILYYTFFPGASNNPVGMNAVDLKTGKLLWNMPMITSGKEDDEQTLYCGMEYNFITGNQYGAHAYLFSQTSGLGNLIPKEKPSWSMYDAMTGEWILTIANASSGTLVEGPSGEILSYTASGGMLRLWNMSKCIEEGSALYNIYSGYHSAEIWRPPQNATIDWAGGYQWSAPIATTYDGNPLRLGISAIDYSDDVALLTQSAPATSEGSNSEGWRIDAGYSATNGALLWGPIKRTIPQWTSEKITAAGDGVYTSWNQEEMTWTTYSIATGKLLWTTTPWTNTWNYFGSGSVIGDGIEICWAFGGQVACYDVTTGAEIWSWSTGSAGYDTPYGVWPIYGSPAGLLADGKFYIGTGHEYTPPVFKGAKVYCLNATTGKEIWSIIDWPGSKGDWVIGDGVFVSPNIYDMQLYAYGKGPTTTTVTAPDTVQPLGTQILVQGSVMDISAGSQQDAVAANFPHGLPCIADADMSSWMEYVYEQQPKPTNATGVKVTISVLDPNNNCYDVGTTTSTIDGFFKLSFTPQVPGEYYVYATFSGSESYYGSSAVTAINVEEAPAATAPPTAPPSSLADLYFLPATIGIIIAIAVVGAVLVLMLRKR
jgi:outer membrane protein assembly factor BamB